MIFCFEQERSDAIVSRDSSSIRYAVLPNECGDEGLPKASCAVFWMTAPTSGSSGEVDAQSRYTEFIAVS
jgi:hypothetical protein